MNIPKRWCETVARILREAKPGTVFIRERARRDWASLTASVFDYELREALASALANEILAGQEYMMDEPGETYGFIFSYGRVPVYAKLNLTAQGQVVIIYSAHRPLKGEAL